VPLYLFYPGAGQQAVILPQILTPSIMIEVFGQI
jgi:thiol:disulfide interchange protein